MSLKIPNDILQIIYRNVNCLKKKKCNQKYFEIYMFDNDFMIIVFKYDGSYAFNYRILNEYREDPKLYDTIWHFRRETEVPLNKNY